MRVLAIDPGSEKSAWTIFDPERKEPIAFSISENRELLSWIRRFKIGDIDWLVIEIVKSYGNVMGDSILHTVEWIGRFSEAYGDGPICRLSRKEIATNLCGRPQAKDKNIRQAVIDFYGGQKKAIGLKKSPGVIYGAKKDIFSALAVALVFSDQYNDPFLI